MLEIIVASPGTVWLDFVGHELVGIWGDVVRDRYKPDEIHNIIRDYNEKRSKENDDH